MPDRGTAMMALVLFIGFMVANAWVRQMLNQPMPAWITRSALDLVAAAAIGAVAVAGVGGPVLRIALAAIAVVALAFPVNAVHARLRAYRNR